jgi:hypothetical protein
VKAGKRRRPPRLELLWPDGSVTTARSYAGAERAIRAAQWHTFKDARSFRRAMRERAHAWSGAPVKAPGRGQTSRQFIRSLAEAGLFMLVDNNQEVAK